MKAAKTPEAYFQQQTTFVEEQNTLRSILLETGLEEHIKWGVPVYRLDKHNVVGMCAFKGYFGIWFYQGALLADPEKKLINANEGTTKSLRQWRMNSMDEINKPLIRQYVFESIENFKAGRIQLPERNRPLILPDELKNYLEQQQLTSEFESMNLTNKRDYAEYIATAKREETKEKRLEKIGPMIRAGVGLNDKYK